MTRSDDSFIPPVESDDKLMDTDIETEHKQDRA